MIRVCEWKAEAGRPIPKPILEDDQKHFPSAVVRAVHAWLASIVDGFSVRDPSPIRIWMGAGNSNAQVEYGEGNWLNVPGYGEHHFKPCTVEILFRDGKRKGPILAKYRYLVARTPDCRDIVGPELGMLRGGDVVIQI